VRLLQPGHFHLPKRQRQYRLCQRVYSLGNCADVPNVIVAVNRADSIAQVQIPGGSYLDLMNDNQPFQGGMVSVPAQSFLVLEQHY